MSTHLRRGALIWILWCFTFLMGLSALDALVVWEVKGYDFILEPYLLGKVLGEISAATYFWTSLTTTFFFLGLTAIVGHLRLPPHPSILEGLSRLKEDLSTNAITLESVQVGLSQRLEQNQIAIETIPKNVMVALSDTEKEIQGVLNKQRKTVREFCSTRSSTIEEEIVNTKTLMASTLEKQSERLEKIHNDLSSTIKRNVGTREELVNELKAITKTLRDLERSTEQNVAGLQWRITKIEEQTSGLADLLERIERIETRLTMPEPSLTSRDNSEKITGMSRRLADGLKVMGITSVYMFITTDSMVMAEKTGFPRDMIKKLQANAQLLLVPGIGHIDAELLGEVGVTSRKELASEDPIELARKIAIASKAYVEQGKMLEVEGPTIEEVWSWIRFAKL